MGGPGESTQNTLWHVPEVSVLHGLRVDAFPHVVVEEPVLRVPLDDPRRHMPPHAQLEALAPGHHDTQGSDDALRHADAILTVALAVNFPARAREGKKRAAVGWRAWR